MLLAIARTRLETPRRHAFVCKARGGFQFGPQLRAQTGGFHVLMVTSLDRLARSIIETRTDDGLDGIPTP
jgi:hypothetical protein